MEFQWCRILPVTCFLLGFFLFSLLRLLWVD